MGGRGDCCLYFVFTLPITLSQDYFLPAIASRYYIIIASNIAIVVPEIVWIDRNVTVPEGGDRELCFMSDIGTAQPYDVSVGVRGKGDNPASPGNHYLLSL